MKYIKLIAIVFVVLSCGRNLITVEDVPEYKLLLDFSRNIKPETELVLCGYGFNNFLPKGYQFINGVANFSVDYYLYKNKDDAVSVDFARSLLVSVAGSLLKEINSNSTVRSNLDEYPFTSDRIVVSINFVDKDKIGLGQGVSDIYFSKGKIKY